MNLRPVPVHRLGGPALAALLLAGTGPAARAFVFEIGEVKGSFDTTLSAGGLYRLQDPDRQYYGLTAGGLQRSVNADDGNLNYRQGMSSFLVKANHDLQLDYRNAGVFVRGYYFNDFVNSNSNRDRTQLNGEARDIVAEGGELLDAYLYLKADLGSLPATLRFGRQVLSWGESTFIPNGINSINPIDVAKLRTPGSELKEALRPLSMASGSVNLTDTLSLEAFYLFGWERTRVDPPGTYFSTNDFVAKGGSKVYLGFGAIADSAALGSVNRGPDNEPDDQGQYGVNLRWLAERLNSTEFGLYYLNYHSRLPVISARTPASPISAALVQSTAASLAQTSLVPAMIPVFGAGTSTALTTLLGAALTGVPSSALPASMQPFYPAAAQIAAGARTIGFLTSAQTAHYLIEFPKDVHLVGASFNTSIRGVALQGELSYRANQPLQADDVELLFAALSSINPLYGANNQLGSYAGQLNTYVRGWRRHKVWTGQLTATKVGRGILGAAQTTLIAEAGFVRADLPAKSVLRYDAPGTFVGGEIAYMNGSGSNPAGIAPLSEPSAAFADDFSWGYQLVGRLDYTNVFAGVNVSPLVVFAHDVGGNTPLPLGNFLHGRKTITLGADFTYQNAWAVELRYVNFGGAGRYNLLGDRDYVSATLKYSF
ncbi:MAG: DUF1302 domain-containing protein [Verrucomicrobiota bacterium]